MACFKCGKSGHWAKDCNRDSDTECAFCGKKGHETTSCLLQKTYKPQPSAPIPVPISKTRQKKACKSWEVILYENHLTVTQTYKVDVDDMVKTMFAKQGIVDDHALAEACFDPIVCSFTDPGHLAILGYIVAKYCDTSNTILKKFLRAVALEYDDAAKFERVLKDHFRVAPYVRGGKIHFRKFTGFVV